MPLDTHGRTRHTIERLKRNQNRMFEIKFQSKSLNPFVYQDCVLQLLRMNKEYLVNSFHENELITSLAFVHTARRFYR